MLFVIFPFSNVLSFWTFKSAVTLFSVFNPTAFVKCIFEIVVFSETFFVSVHPLPFIYYVLSLHMACGFSEKSSSSMLFAAFKFPSIL